MFNQLTNFAFDRNWKQAIGFYIAYFLLVVAFTFVAAFVLATLIGSGGSAQAVQEHKQVLDSGVKAGAVIAIIVSVVMMTLVIRAKKMGGFQVLLYLLGTLVLSVLAGGLGGLIIPAYLTTRKYEPKTQ